MNRVTQVNRNIEIILPNLTTRHPVVLLVKGILVLSSVVGHYSVTQEQGLFTSVLRMSMEIVTSNHLLFRKRFSW